MDNATMTLDAAIRTYGNCPVFACGGSLWMVIDGSDERTARRQLDCGETDGLVAVRAF